MARHRLLIDMTKVTEPARSGSRGAGGTEDDAAGSYGAPNMLIGLYDANDLVTNYRMWHVLPCLQRCMSLHLAVHTQCTHVWADVGHTTYTSAGTVGGLEQTNALIAVCCIVLRAWGCVDLARPRPAHSFTTHAAS